MPRPQAEQGCPLAATGLYEIPVEALDPSSHPVQAVSPCPICGGEQAAPRFAVAGVDAPVVVCVGCGLGRFHPAPDAEQVRALYPDEYYGEPGRKFQPLIERLVRLVGARHIGFLSRNLRPGARVLDVGCGRGVLLGALAEHGFEVHGVEISEEAARGADPRARIRIAQDLRAAGYPADHFDEVILWHVLEHLSDPRAVLEEVHRILAPGGRLVVAVPNFASAQARWTGAAWFHLDLPRHLFQFPLAGLRELLGQIGFRVRSEHHFSLRQNPFGWIQSVLNLSPRLPRNGLYTLLHRRSGAAAHPFDRRTRRWLLFWLVVGAPLGLLATLVETACRSGATVHVVANKDGGASAGAQSPGHSTASTQGRPAR